MNTTFHIFPLTEVAERAQDASDEVTSIEILTGHHMPGQRGQKLMVLNIRRQPDGNWPQKSFATLERHIGQYTAVFKPTREILFLDSEAGNPQAGWSYGSPMQGVWPPVSGAPLPGNNKYSGKETLELVQIIMQQELQIQTLKNELQETKEELQQFATAGDKFSYALQGVLERFVIPMFTSDSTPANLRTQPMQGTDNNQTMNWTQYPIRNQDNDNGLQDAMTILHDAFGPEALVRIAKRLQEQPALVNTLTNML